MLIGSHNTMTYLKPRKWWMWFGKFIAKCQKLTIEEQYDKGAIWFDIRISFPKTKIGYDKPIFSHGSMDYKGRDVETVLQFLDRKGAYCRIALEKGGETEKELFKNYVVKWMKEYPNVKFTQIAKKDEWVNLITPNAVLPYTSKDAYASCNGSYPQYNNLPGILRAKSWSGLLIDDLYPWFYAKFNNKKNIKKYKDEDILLLMDFVEIQ